MALKYKVTATGIEKIDTARPPRQRRTARPSARTNVRRTAPKSEPTHPVLRENAKAERMYGATTAERKYGQEPRQMSGVEHAQRDWEKRQAAAKANNDIAAGSSEQEKLNARYGNTTPARNKSVGQTSTWTTTPDILKNR